MFKIFERQPIETTCPVFKFFVHHWRLDAKETDILWLWWLMIGVGVGYAFGWSAYERNAREKRPRPWLVAMIWAFVAAAVWPGILASLVTFILLDKAD